MKFRKPKFWDYKKPNLIAYLLKPLTLLIEINNLIINLKTKKKSNKIKTICVGNIYLGGTGKTPTTIKIFQILKKLNFKVVVGKKNYDSHIDERIILKNKTKLIEKNTRENILKNAIKTKQDFLIFDDGLQDTNIDYNLKIVCFDSQNWIGNGFLIPSGPLREKISSLKKYDCIFLKDNIRKEKKIIKTIKKINKEIEIFQTYFTPSNINEFNKSDKYLIFSGIGNPKSLKTILMNNKIKIVDEIIYPDHFKYGRNDIFKIKNRANSLGAKIITTEKDYVKILKTDQKNISFLKINLKIKNEKKFINFLKKY